MDNGHITSSISPAGTNDALSALFAAAWPDTIWSDFAPLLSYRLAYVCMMFSHV
jgi:hypothetical protein